MNTTKKRELLLFRLKILKALLKKLDGKCSESRETCPITISKNFGFGNYYSHLIWNCDHCHVNFFFLNTNIEKIRNKCPCYYGTPSDIIILRLEEVIEEVEQELKDLTK